MRPRCRGPASAATQARVVGGQYLGRTQIGDATRVLELLSLLLLSVRGQVRSRQDLVIENLLLRHQLAVLTRPTRTRRRPRLRTWDKVLWVLARRIGAAWRQRVVMVSPDTVVQWHRQGWRLFWRWTSRHAGGRPRLSAEVQQLIATMSCENRLWGCGRAIPPPCSGSALVDVV